jgi:hypothetical protein
MTKGWRATLTAIGALVLSALAGCAVFDDDERLLRIELPFCGERTTQLEWAAFSKDGRNWTELTPIDGVVSFEASGALTVAYGDALNAGLYSATADELSEVRCFQNRRTTKLLEGTVRGESPGESFFVTVGPGLGTNSPFTAHVPDGPLDLFAHTQNSTTGVPQRVIGRHGIDLPHGAEIPMLDFASGEAKPFTSATASVVGSEPGDYNNLFWHWGNYHTLRSAGTPGGTPIQYFGVPEALLGPDDFHTLRLHDFLVNAHREVIFYYRRTRATTLTFGPPASAPLGTVLEESPCPRLRVRIASQAEYPSFVSVYFVVNTVQITLRQIDVVVSRAFLGQTPSTWIVETPDVPRPDGTCLITPPVTEWHVFATPQDGRLALYLGARGRDGEVRRNSTSFWP